MEPGRREGQKPFESFETGVFKITSFESTEDGDNNSITFMFTIESDVKPFLRDMKVRELMDRSGVSKILMDKGWLNDVHKALFPLEFKYDTTKIGSNIYKLNFMVQINKSALN